MYNPTVLNRTEENSDTCDALIASINKKIDNPNFQERMMRMLFRIVGVDITDFPEEVYLIKDEMGITKLAAPADLEKRKIKIL